MLFVLSHDKNYFYINPRVESVGCLSRTNASGFISVLRSGPQHMLHLCALLSPQIGHNSASGILFFFRKQKKQTILETNKATVKLLTYKWVCWLAKAAD